MEKFTEPAEIFRGHCETEFARADVGWENGSADEVVDGRSTGGSLGIDAPADSYVTRRYGTGRIGGDFKVSLSGLAN